MSVEGLFDRCMALLRLREVEALIIVVDSFEFLDAGLPVDRIQAVYVAGTTSGRELQRLRAALAAYLPSGEIRCLAPAGGADAAASRRRITEGATAPASIEAFTRTSSVQPCTIAAVSTGSSCCRSAGSSSAPSAGSAATAVSPATSSATAASLPPSFRWP